MSAPWGVAVGGPGGLETYTGACPWGRLWVHGRGLDEAQRGGVDLGPASATSHLVTST